MSFENSYGFQIMPKSIGWLHLNHTIYKVFCLWAHYFIKDFRLWPSYVPVLDISVNWKLLCAPEWHDACKHFEQNVSKSPNVDSKSLLLFLNDLRRLIIDGTHKSSPSLQRVVLLWEIIFFFLLLFWLVHNSLLVHLLGVSEINDFAIVVLVKHDVLGFQISMHNILSLKIFDEVYQLSEKDFDYVFGKSTSAFLDYVV